MYNDLDPDDIRAWEVIAVVAMAFIVLGGFGYIVLHVVGIL